MTNDQMTELAARLRAIAPLMPVEACLAHESTLHQAADLIKSMAQRAPLTEQQIRALVQPMDWPPSVTEIVRAVEQAHGIVDRQGDAA